MLLYHQIKTLLLILTLNKQVLQVVTKIREFITNYCLNDFKL
jgi:hypothetical protein